MQYFVAVITFMAIFSLSALPQSNFRKACIIPIQGDTVKGYIDDREWIQNPEKISFKPTLESKDEITYDVSNASYFRIDGEDAYQCFTLPVSMDRIEMPNLSTGPDTSKQVKTVFLKLLVNGCNVNLYSYADNLKMRYFYWEKSANVPVELGYKMYYRGAEYDLSKVITLKSYLNQLSYLGYQYGHDSKELTRKIEAAQYIDKDLSEIIVMVNGGVATNFCMIAASKDRMVIFPFGTIRVRRSVLTKMSEVGSLLVIDKGSDNSQSFLPAIGFGFDLARKSGSRFFAREELIFSMDKLSSSDWYYNNSIFYEYSISQWNIALCNTANYHIYYKPGLKIYAGTGISVNYSHLYEVEYYYHNSLLPETDPESTEIRSDFLKASQLWVNIPLQLGARIGNAYHVNFTYYFPMRRVVNQGDKMKIDCMELGISYSFRN
ncbi:MAG: hypothetical protein JXB49_24985 [Bacteroidales bacterium]|nr:hypothetical protein [Bacteroidales bacterium]